MYFLYRKSLVEMKGAAMITAILPVIVYVGSHVVYLSNVVVIIIPKHLPA